MSYTIKKLDHHQTALAKQLIQLWNEDDDQANRHIPGDDYLQNLLAKDSFHAYVAIENEQLIGG
jgi:hypothetical protein